jgi:hypothetical protein
VNGVRITVRLACVYAAFLGCAPVSGAEAFITDQTGDEVSVLDLVVARIPVLGKPRTPASPRPRIAVRIRSLSRDWHW